MEREVRNRIQRATQAARELLEREYAEQLEGTFDLRLDGTVAPEPGAHLDPEGRMVRRKLVAAVEHRRATGEKESEAVAGYLREAAFTTLNRFVALKMLEARGLVQECVSRGDRSSGFKEFTGLAPGLVQLPDHGYRLYLECLFDEIGREVRVLFDRRDPSALLWPRRQALLDLLGVLNDPELSEVWGEDETLGWVYQYFNGDDERRQMRSESQAPRNSRELAVRNQFFTPRYVVRFLADNTLGRLWLEMRGSGDDNDDGGSRLDEACEFLVRSSVETSRRPRKDPRDLRVLDPACGSGHFLLYCFDLLLEIYEEAWESGATGRTLRQDYPDREALRRAAPALIVEHNLYGVEIDPRAAQIAALALWLRAQRAWNDAGVPAAGRPGIRRTRVVVAEPMPGDAGLVDEFAAGLEPPLLAELFRRMVAESRLAGEMGTLLRLEKGIAKELKRAREQYEEAERAPLLPGIEPERREGEADLSGIDDDGFFHRAEELLLAALHDFAETTSGGAGVRRRLFADDAAQGIALIEVVRTRFDVVLMNPPFGAGSLAAKKRFESSYPRTKNDVYAAFVERGIELLHPAGLLGAITSRTGFFLPRFRKWREEILLEKAAPIVFADLGLGVMDAALVEAAAYCLEVGPNNNGRNTVFIRALEEIHNKSSVLLATINDPERAKQGLRFEVDPLQFKTIPGSSFAYWVSDRILRLFDHLPAFETNDREARRGVNTNADERFLRLYWETSGPEWQLHLKGGVWSPFYADPHVLLKWWNDGEELQAERVTTRVYKTAIIPSRELYFRPGLTWSRRTKSDLSIRVMPAGCIFGDKGPAAFVNGDAPANLLSLLAIGASRIFMTFVELQLAAAEPTGRGGVARSYEVGVIQRTPVPNIEPSDGKALAELARRAWSLKRSLDTRTETSHAFVLPVLLQVEGGTLEERAEGWVARVGAVEAELAAIQSEIDERCFELYGIDDEDRRAITDGFGGGRKDGADAVDDEDEDGDEGEEEDEEETGADLPRLAAELVSWAVGVAFGRFDVRLATGECPLPEEPEPFDPLPVCSPAMLTGDDGLPLPRAPEGYPLDFPENGVLVDDTGHPLDLTAAVRAVFETVFGGDADRWWSDVAAVLDPKGHDLRAWLASSYFEHHLKRHSKSRRKAPILWQLATASGRYSVWLAVHRLTRDSFYQLQNDVVTPKLQHEERRLAQLVQTAGDSPTAGQRKEIAVQEGFVEELRAFLEEVQRVAPLWNPTLDDGVVLTMAPLWRLVPQHRTWQKELAKRWRQLAAGDHDWAHLAMHLWPERVVPKCTEDRSLAIAHGLEDELWREDEDGKWQPRELDDRTLGELVEQRTSPAVKAALQSLLDAPAATTGSKKRKKRRGRSRK